MLSFLHVQRFCMPSVMEQSDRTVVIQSLSDTESTNRDSDCERKFSADWIK